MRGSIPARFAPVLFSGIVSIIMVTIVSGAVILATDGYGNDFGARWFRAFVTTWPIAFPVLLIVAPGVRRFVSWVTAAPPHRDPQRR